MPAELRDDLPRAISERDGYRCHDCGAAVDADLVTLCFPCQATRGLRAYAGLLRTAAADRLPEFVKQMTRDFGRTLLAYSELIDPSRFDPAQALEEFGMWRVYLDTLAGLAGAARASKTLAVNSNNGVRREEANTSRLPVTIPAPGAH
jgi:hypothetical protein